jgi:hypothetical protein
MANPRSKLKRIVSPDWLKDWLMNIVDNISDQNVLMRINSINGGSRRKSAV